MAVGSCERHCWFPMWWQGLAVLYSSCNTCSPPSITRFTKLHRLGKAFYLVLLCGVRYGFFGVIFLFKGKGYFSKCYICIVRKNNMDFFSPFFENTAALWR